MSNYNNRERAATIVESLDDMPWEEAVLTLIIALAIFGHAHTRSLELFANVISQSIKKIPRELLK